MSILFRFVVEFMSIKRYSAPGLYSTMGLYWFLSSTAIEKSDNMGRRFELLPPLIRLWCVDSSHWC